jgi:DinB superfamily
MKKPVAGEFPPYAQKYIDLVKTNDILKEMENQVIDMQEFFSLIPEEKELFAYANGKWTVKEVIGHIIDTERILAYRALRLARYDKTPLPGFDENHYVANANYNARNLYNLAHEFALLRESNLDMFKFFDKEALSQNGIVNNYVYSTRGLLFMIVGHAKHHVSVIKERYLEL